MKLEAVGKPVKYRFRTGEEIVLKPGIPTEMPDTAAMKLLEQAGERVRIAPASETHAAINERNGLLVEPTTCRNPVYWEGCEGDLLGPGIVTHVAKESTFMGDQRFWLCVEYRGSWRWIHESLLRSRATYEANRAKPKSMVVR